MDTAQVPTLPPSAPLLPQEKQGEVLPPGRVAVPPPYYAGYHAIYTDGTMPAPGGFQPRQRRSRTRRFIVRTVHTLILLVLFFMLLPTFLRGLAHVARKIDRWQGNADVALSGPDLPNDCKSVLAWKALPEHSHELLDAGFDHPHHPHEHYAARTSVKLPLTSDLLYFIGRGTLSHGLVRILDDGDSENEVNVTVTFAYGEERLLEEAKVCLLEQEGNQHGVGIFTPTWRHRRPHDHHHHTMFLVDIHLPAKIASDPLHIRAFKTDMPLFRHYIADLVDSVHFDSVSLSTSNVPIHTESLSADHAAFRSSNSVISGNFTVWDELQIRTSNSPIIANVTMLNQNDGIATNVTLTTSNSPLNANISLVSTSDKATGGSFNIVTHTSNSPLSVNFTTSPVDSLLHFSGSTSNSPAHVALDAAYEGSFALHGARFFPPRVEERTGVADPAGKDRTRTVAVKSIVRGVVDGEVTWDPSENRQFGSVELRSSNMPIVLVV
ncbi:hypothetical protein PsYK624_044980 [Phanerochaete sordida]|uniref:Uncharacterized protein n=1 Tax=Phanerochaete sordida TaxID=48140 RepID=A0A9P3G5W8_9APHY|nr:hypothetical protein PsYK624_044980 [Phanerochaete sordida]